MNQWACEFFAGSIAEWVMVFVTLFTGLAVAFLAYQANRATHVVRGEVASDRQRRARTFGHMISVEVGGAQSAFYNLRSALEREIDEQRIPDVESIRRVQRHLNLSFLPNVIQGMGNVDLLPESCAAPLLSGMAAIENVRRALTVTLTSPSNLNENGLLTPVGMENVERVCAMLKSMEIRFHAAHRALWEFNYPGQQIFEWQYPEGAIKPEGL